MLTLRSIALLALALALAAPAAARQPLAPADSATPAMAPGHPTQAPPIHPPPPRLEIVEISPAAPNASQSVVVSYELDNTSPLPVTGTVSGSYDGHALAPVKNLSPAAQGLAPGQSLHGLLTLPPQPAGSHDLTLNFGGPLTCTGVNVLGGPVRCQPNVQASATTTLAIAEDPLKVDLDQDGIPDVVETALLAKFTPYMRFSIDSGTETFRPADVVAYVEASELQDNGDEGKGVIVSNDVLKNDPSQLYAGDDSLMNDPVFRTDRYLNPMGDAPRHGEDWGPVMAQRNVGLYGHVALFQNLPPQGGTSCPSLNDGQNKPGCRLDPSKTYYKVEYWQFFGFNSDNKPFDAGDHESDWCTVQVFVDKATGALAEVDMFFHGRMAGYVLGKPGEAQTDMDGGLTRQFSHGGIGDLSFTWNSGPVADAENNSSGHASQDRVVRLYRDPVSGAYVHPEVYIERGSHEFWPTEAWSMAQAPNHNGADTAHSYLAAPPPNLGEVEHPLAETPAALLILRYNGHWGAFNHDNAPPQGPPLHGQWLFPTNATLPIKPGSF